MNQYPAQENLRVRGWLAGAALALAPALALAQSAAPANPAPASGEDANVTKLEKFVVTGSYIPAAADEANASPVVVMTAQDIQASGLTKSLLDVIRKSVPQIVGGNNIGVENGNVSGNSTNGGSQVALRNTSTLVLIDGMRVAFSPVAGTGGFQFVDLNVVPVSAVERIEVLTDGASAIYGSDAVSGVINIILKKNYQGLELGGYFGFTKSDKTGAMYRDRSVRLIGGSATEKTGVTISAEWTRSDPLYERDYNYTSPVYLTASYPGVVNDALGNFYRLNPNLNAPPSGPARSLAEWAALGVYVPTPSAQVPQGFDLSGRPTFLGALDKQIATVALQHQVSDALRASATVLYSKTHNQYNLNPQPIIVRINTNAANTGLPGIPITDVGAQVRNRFLGGGNRVYINDTDAIRGTFVLEGSLGGDWSWTADALYNTAAQKAVGTNQILDSALQSAIANGDINLTAINQAAGAFANAAIFGDSLALLDSQLIAYNLRVNGSVFDLPAGTVAVALGAGYRKETLEARADMNSVINPVTGGSAWNNGVTLNPFAASRSVESLFAEVRIPLTSERWSLPGLHKAELNAAVRHEVYSASDEKPTVPKISLRWLPLNDEFAVRATYSKSFAAPTLYSLYGPTNSGATNSLNGLIAYDSAGNAIGPFTPIQGNVQTGSNPNLLPSHSKNYTVGFVYSPKAVKGLSLSIDYVNIKETDIVGTLAADTVMIQDVERYGPASVYAPYVRLGNFSQLGGSMVTGRGQLHVNPSNVYVDQLAVNVGKQDQEGIDVTLQYDWTNAAGAWSVQSAWNFLRSFVVQSAPDLPANEFAGFNGFGTLPKVRSRTTATWQRGAYNALLGATFIKSVTSAGDGRTLPNIYQFDAQFGVDLAALSPRLSGLRVSLGVNNLTDEYPPVDDSVFSDPPADTGLYGSFGRFYFVDVTYKF
jgi:iron complex outermembrane receptor protein